MDLKEQATSGLKWSAASQGTRQIVQLLTTLVLARLLEPSDFGLLGMAMVVIGFAILFRDLGTSAAVIQRKDLTEEMLSSVFWINLSFGFCVTLIIYFTAPLVASFYKEVRLTPILQLLSLTFLFASLGILQQSLLERDLAFGKLARIEATSVLVGSAVGISMAFLGFGVYSLVCQSLSSIVLNTALLWILSKWRPRLVFRIKAVKEIWSYSVNLTAFSVLNYFARSADYLLVGRYLGADALGYYTIAYRLMLYPLQSVSVLMGRVIFPVLSKLQDYEDRFQRAFLKTASSVALVMFPLMLGVFALARPFVFTVFGDQWGPVVPLIMILAPASMISSILMNAGSIYKAKGRTDWMFRWSIVGSTVRITAYIVGLRWGVIGVASGYTIAIALLAYPTLAIPFSLIRLKMTRLLKSISMPLLTGLVMFGAVKSLELLLGRQLGDLWTLTTGVAAGVAIYFVLNLLMNREQTIEVLGAFRPKPGA
ncbi:MAG: MOP flippase family protein [Candidatus Latescibacteria bacterium]|nr:MOP flippase family protein [Candidatus Latescibacterota bacterium]NIO00964.1 MOP flippase family protein [Candidatus Latescibacterota bacterium]NIO27363.1 MOP flippase family protein [Candidatus Latescibacterota bacterium]NIO54885.1 MOP flippase family protein [Candidatus Latescibacterota bacterium]NIT00974.1 MOP flippase family protein [Candidatus Latescibacterota bacterium]